MADYPNTSEKELDLHQNGSAKCPWCKNAIPHEEIKRHRECCPYRNPVPTIPGIDIFFRVTKNDRPL